MFMYLLFLKIYLIFITLYALIQGPERKFQAEKTL